MGKVTQNLTGLERVYNTRVTQGPPRAVSVPAPRVITVMCQPSPQEAQFRAIPYAPKRRQVDHYQRLSSFTTDEENARRAEGRIQQRTDTMLRSLQPYVGHDGRVVRGSWLRKRED